jgi:translation initiation factor 2 subunit 2
MNYKEMLKRAKAELPEEKSSSERFEIPKIKGHIEGNKTVLSNFNAIATHLGRKQEHLLKYILKQLATPGEISKNRVIIGRKVPAAFINTKIEDYSETYVFCKECTKPDTQLSITGKFSFIKCMACGAKTTVPLLK